MDYEAAQQLTAKYSAIMPVGVGDNQTRHLYQESCDLRRRVADLEVRLMDVGASTEPEIGHGGYLALLREMAELHRRKAADYGSDTDPLANVRGSVAIGIDPDRGAWLRALDKVQRINRHYSGHALANESLEDSLKDLAAYALIALALRREKAGVS